MTERAGVVGGVLLALLAVLLVCLSACQATIRVGIKVAANGSGTVSVTASLDPAAAAALPDLAQMLRTADLQAAGWRIDGPTAATGGGATVVASKAFSTPAQAAEVIGELSGPAGPFHDLKVARRASLTGTTTGVSGTVDLTCGIACFGDAQLRQVLGANLGFDPAKLQEAGIDPGNILTFEVDVRLPGSVRSSNAPVRIKGESQWPIKLGDMASLATTSRIVRPTRRVALAAAAVAVVVALAAATWLVRVGRRRRRGRGGRGRSRPLHSARR